jgi:hypothetical protein
MVDMAEDSRARKLYKTAKQLVIDEGYLGELAWQDSLAFSSFTESDLLREAAWVILCSGFRESVVRRHFDFISLCFCDWESAAVICRYAGHCRATALTRFANERKIHAILATAKHIRTIGFEQFKACILQAPIDALKTLPFIGEITSFHLAKNLGFSTAKPDRHLRRLAAFLGYSDAASLCRELSEYSGDSVQLVDLVLWRFAERQGTVPASYIQRNSTGLFGTDQIRSRDGTTPTESRKA